MLDSIVGGALFLKLLFLKLFLNLARNEYPSNSEKEFRYHVIYTPNIFSWIFEFKVTLKLFLEQI